MESELERKYLADFPRDEYIQRWSRARRQMSEENIDALLIVDEEDLTYFAGFRKILPNISKIRSLAMHLLILPLDGDPVLVLPQEMRGNAEHMSWVEDVRFFRSGFSFLPDIDAFHVIETTMRDLKLEDRALGLELGDLTRVDWCQKDFESLKSIAPCATLRDSSGLVWKIRGVKSEREQRCLRKAAEITCRGMKAALESMRPGMTEREIAHEFYRASLKDSEDATLKAFFCVRAGAHRYGMSDSRPSEIKIGRGDIVLLDGGTQFKGYFCDMSRIGCIGQPNQEQERLFEAARKAEEAGLGAVRAGVKAGQIQDAIDEVIDSRNVRNNALYNGSGHGVGLTIHEPPFISKNCDTVLQEGMVLSVEPTLYDEVASHYVMTGEGPIGSYGVFGVEDNVIITNIGYINMTDIDRGLWVVK